MRAIGAPTVDDLTDEELDQAEMAGPPTLAEFEESQRVLASIISWGDSALMPQTYSQSQWIAVLAERARLARPLLAAELRSIVDVDGGLNGDH
ncbi:MAG: hypothetical protein ABIO17_06930 [Pseudoxanthomonas sp.]